METILAALIAGVFTLLAAFIPGERGSEVKPGPQASKRGRLRPTRRVRIVLGFSFAVVAGVSMFFFLRHVITPSPEATIEAPGQVTTGSVIEGQASNLHHDQLFLVLRSTQGEGLRYYPQAQVSDWTGGNWRAQLNALPGAGTYDLIAVAVTAAEASGELRMYIEICHTTGCAGIDVIPEGVETLASVHVIIL